MFRMRTMLSSQRGGSCETLNHFAGSSSVSKMSKSRKKGKISTLYLTDKIGDPSCPEDVVRAKRAQRQIEEKYAVTRLDDDNFDPDLGNLDEDADLSDDEGNTVTVGANATIKPGSAPATMCVTF